MDKYRRVPKVKETDAKPDNEIRVTAIGSVSAYVSFAAKVFNEMEKDELVVKATGHALAKAVQLVEVIKRRFKGLHQMSSVSTQEIIDEYEPLEEGLDNVTDKRNVAYMEITLSKNELDTKNVGYQAPIDESLVQEFDPEEMTRSRGRGRGRGKGLGKGKSKSEDGKGKKGKGKGKSKSPEKGKSKSPDKGKGKSKSDGKSKDGKSKSKGYDDWGSSKSKGKGKASKGWDDYGTGKSKGKGYGSSWGGGWDSWDDWSYSSYNNNKGTGKGKGKSKGYGW